MAAIAHAIGRRTRLRRSPPVVAVAALGKRSLSGYLSHSLIFSLLLAAYGLERAGLPGPAEVVLRRLVYGPVMASRTAPADGRG